MSMSSLKFNEIESPTSARGIGPSAVSMERTVVNWPWGSTMTGSPVRNGPPLTMPA